MSNGTKACTRCGKTKPLSEFYKDASRKDGLNHRCKECDGECGRAYRAANKGKEQARQRAYQAANRERLQARDRAYHAANEEKDWAGHLRRDYGITPEEYAKMLEAQGSKCAICGMTSEGNGRRLCVDHDHETDEVRGLLCTYCNRGLGHFQDSLVLLHSAAAYLGSRGATS